MSIYEIGKCDYCGNKNAITRPTPFMTDGSAMMCEVCWNSIQIEYENSNGEYIPNFQSDKSGYDVINVRMSDELATCCEKYNLDEKIKKFLKNMELKYNNLDGYCEETDMTMCQWIFENTGIEELNGLSEKERFLFGVGFLTCEISYQ